MREDMAEPPSKRARSGENFVNLINDCYDLKFRKTGLTLEEEDSLKLGTQRIRETLESTISSSDLSFGTTRTSAKINWGKCLGLLLEDGHNSLDALRVLTERLSPGGGLL